MAGWKSHLKADPLPWLLEEGNPSVRYIALTKVIGAPENDREVKRARQAIMSEGLVPRLLGKQKEGSWNEPGRFYLDKYKGTVWQLIILAEHEASGTEASVRAACDYILRCAQDVESHGFAVNEGRAGSGGRHGEVIPCLTGNMVWSLVKLGCLDDERVQKGIGWITRYQRFDDGEDAGPEGWPYDRYETCWGSHTCHMGVVKSLKALSAIPVKDRGPAVKKTIADGCRYILKHRVYKQSHDLSKVSKPGWLKLQFPLMYQTDVLEIVGILLDLGVRDEAMSDAMDVIVSKQADDGRWRLENTFNGRYHFAIEAKWKPSKWITLRALKAIKGYYG